MMLKHSIHRKKNKIKKTKDVDEFDLPNLVCRGFDPVISRRENCHKHVQHMCRGKGREDRLHEESASVCVHACPCVCMYACGRNKTLPSILGLDYMWLTYSS